MVLHSNINLNQKVEISYQNRELTGTVRYKGAVKSLEGDWVGIELDEPIGKHNGMYKGIKYFECRLNHGVFVRASSIRFIQNTKRRIFNKYYRRWDTGVDESLFSSGDVSEPDNQLNNKYYISPDNRSKSNCDLFDTLGSRFSSARSFPMTGSVSRAIPAATMTRPTTAAAVYTYTSTPVHFGAKERKSWEPVPSIPKTHMPHSAQRNQTRRGWQNSHWTREISYPKARHSMKFTQWNDISF